MRRCVSCRLLALDLKLYLRNPATILWTLFVPALVLSLLLLSFSDERNSLGRISVDVIDNDGTTQSERLVQAIVDALRAIPRLEATIRRTDNQNPLSGTQIRLSVPKNFELGIAAGQPPQIGVRYTDDHSYAGYVGKVIVEAAISDFVSRGNASRRPAPTYVEQIITDGIPFPVFALTGCTVMLLYSTCLFGFAVPLVNLRQSGLMRMFNVFPVSPLTYIHAILAGRAIFIIAMCVGLFAYGILAFQIPVSLSASAVATYLALFLIGAVTFLSAGLAIASQARTVSRAMILANLIYFPVILSSNLIVPSRVLPHWMVKVASLLPIGALAEHLRLASQDQLSLTMIFEAAVYFGFWIAGFALLIRPNGILYSERVDLVSRLLGLFKSISSQKRKGPHRDLSAGLK